MAETPQQKYWRNPEASEDVPQKYVDMSVPEFYVGLHEISDYLVSIIEHHWPTSISILELGCGPGRNLAALLEAGYEDVEGIEINPNAELLAYEHWPLVGDLITVGSIEEWLPKTPEVDLVFTSGVLMHLPPESEFVFEEMANLARIGLLINEVEERPGSQPNLRFMRNYQEIFEPLGWHQVDRIRPVASGIGGSITRVFTRIADADAG